LILELRKEYEAGDINLGVVSISIFMGLDENRKEKTVED
jgi:hypothetical protein